MGYRGSYLVTAIGTSIGLLYLIFFVKEPIQKKPKVLNLSGNRNSISVSKNKKDPKKLLFSREIFYFQATLKKFFIEPTKQMFKTLIRKRAGYLRILLYIQIFAYGLLWFNYQLVKQMKFCEYYY